MFAVPLSQTPWKFFGNAHQKHGPDAELARHQPNSPNFQVAVPGYEDKEPLDLRALVRFCPCSGVAETEAAAAHAEKHDRTGHSRNVVAGSFNCPAWDALHGGPGILTPADVRTVNGPDVLLEDFKGYVCSGTPLILRGCFDTVSTLRAMNTSFLEAAVRKLGSDSVGQVCTMDFCHAPENRKEVRLGEFVDEYLVATPRQLAMAPKNKWWRHPKTGSPRQYEFHYRRLGPGEGGDSLPPGTFEAAMGSIVAPRWKCGHLRSRLTFNDWRVMRRGFKIAWHPDKAAMNSILHPHGDKWWSLGVKDVPKQRRARVLVKEGDLLIVPYGVFHETECATPSCVTMNA